MKRTVPAVAEFAAGSAFGMAYAAAGVPASKLADCLAFPDKFSAIELPAETLELKEASYLLARVLRSYKLVQTGSIIDSDVARNLPFSSESLFQEFAAYTEKLLTLFHSIGIRTVTFDPHMNNVLGDERALNSMLRLLRLIAPVLNRTGITLLLPISLPCADSAQPVRLIRFLRESMIPELKVRLDINPHEIPRSLPVPSCGNTSSGSALHSVPLRCRLRQHSACRSPASVARNNEPLRFRRLLARRAGLSRRRTLSRGNGIFFRTGQTTDNERT